MNQIHLLLILNLERKFISMTIESQRELLERETFYDQWEMKTYSKWIPRDIFEFEWIFLIFNGQITWNESTWNLLLEIKLVIIVAFLNISLHPKFEYFHWLIHVKWFFKMNLILLWSIYWIYQWLEWYSWDYSNVFTLPNIIDETERRCVDQWPYFSLSFSIKEIRWLFSANHPLDWEKIDNNRLDNQKDVLLSCIDIYWENIRCFICVKSMIDFQLKRFGKSFSRSNIFPLNEKTKLDSSIEVPNLGVSTNVKRNWLRSLRKEQMLNWFQLFSQDSCWNERWIVILSVHLICDNWSINVHFSNLDWHNSIRKREIFQMNWWSISFNRSEKSKTITIKLNWKVPFVAFWQTFCVEQWKEIWDRTSRGMIDDCDEWRSVLKRRSHLLFAFRSAFSVSLQWIFSVVESMCD